MSFGIPKLKPSPVAASQEGFNSHPGRCFAKCLCVDVSVNFGFYCKCVGSFEHLGLGHSFVYRWINLMISWSKLVFPWISMNFPRINGQSVWKEGCWEIIGCFHKLTSKEWAGYGILFSLGAQNCRTCAMWTESEDIRPGSWRIAWLFSLLCWKFEGFQHIGIIGRGLKSRRPEMTIFRFFFMTDMWWWQALLAHFVTHLHLQFLLQLTL